LDKSVDWKPLRYFVAVAEELHFGRAARRLHMTQPPLSMQIRALEEGLGVALFVREKRAIRLTVAGETLLAEARPLLAGAERLRAAVQAAAQGLAGSLRIAFVSTADYGVLPPVLREFRKRLPGVRMDLVEATSDQQWQALAEGRIDAGFVIAPERLPAGLDRLVVSDEPLVMALPTLREFAGVRAPVPASVLGRWPLIIFPRHIAPAFFDAILQYGGRSGRTPSIAQEAIQMQTIVSLVSAGMGIALVPASLRHLRRTGVRYAALPPQAPRVQTWLVWRKDAVPPALAQFVDIARGQAGGERKPRRQDVA
jgi:DNA-binding transcriptional LysR family regulator